MRLLDLIFGLNVVAGLAGYALRRHRGRWHRRLDHDVYQEQLRAQNEELDDQLDQLLRGKKR